MSIRARVAGKLKSDGLVATGIALVRHSFRKLACRLLFKSASTKGRFSTIYRKNMWDSDGSGSGPGSEIAYTERLRAWMLEVLPKYDVDRFVDAPCGDFNWMKLVVPHLNFKYFGFKIVDEIIADNKASIPARPFNLTWPTFAKTSCRHATS